MSPTNLAIARTLVDAGYKAETVVAALDAGDLALLEHTGRIFVRLQGPGFVNGETE